MMLALNLKGFIPLFYLVRVLVVTDTVNKNAFLAFLETVLLLTLTKGSVLVLHNWTVHHGEEVSELIERFGCELLYLPTYSPDLNPIEHLFAKIKTFIKSLRPATLGELVEAFCNAVKIVTPENVLNSFRRCGYELDP